MTFTRRLIILPRRLLAFTLVLIALMIAPAVQAQTLGLAQAADAETDPAADAVAGPPPELAPEALQALITVLSDEAARSRLLEALAAADPVAPLEVAEEETVPVDDIPHALGARIAEITQDAAQRIAVRLREIGSSFSHSGWVFRGLSGEELGVIVSSLRTLLLVIVITVAVFVTLRLLLKPFYRRIGAGAQDAPLLRKGVVFVGLTAIDVASVLAAWALGYAITVLALGEFGQISFRQTLYLNAFLAVELTKAGLRAIIWPSTGGLRPINLSDRAAHKLDRHANLAISVLGYGHLLIVPLVNLGDSFAAGIGVGALVSLVVVLYLVVLVLRYRVSVADWLTRQISTQATGPETDAPAGPRPPVPGPVGILIDAWHWFTLLYLAILTLVVTARPASAVMAFLSATGQVLLTVLIGSLVLTALGRAVRSGVRLPQVLRRRLPLLEPRVNQIVPTVLGVLRMLVGVGILLYAIDVTGVADVGGALRSQIGLDLTGRLTSVGLILLVAALIWLVINAYVDFRLDPTLGEPPTARLITLLALARNAASITLAILTLMFVLSEIGLDIGPLIASAGVLGLAIGFGAQKLVQDIITGVFIQFENAMNVGDVVTVGGITGTVEKLTVRSVSLRDLAGTFHIIPFSSVDMVANFMREFAYYVCDMGVAYRENVDEVRDAMQDAFARLIEDPEMRMDVLDELEWFGLNAFGDSAVVLRARIKTRPGKQWGVGRAYNAILKEIFDDRGIEIPFPHQTIYFGEGKDGRTQALRLRDDTTTASDETGTVEG
jgi:small-conductance mechanosensitive channel